MIWFWETRLWGRAPAFRRVRLGECVVRLGWLDWSMDGLFEYRFRVNHFKLGFEVCYVMRYGAAVGTTAGIAELEVFVHYIVCNGTPA